MTLWTPAEAQALEYRLQLARRAAYRAAAEAALHGDAGARYTLGEHWEPVANASEEPDYHGLP